MNMNLGDSDFIRIRDYFATHYGINLQNKRALIEGRLSFVVQQEGFKSFTEFIDSAFKNPNSELMTLMVTKLTTNYTYFMREPLHYEFLVSTAIPTLIPLIRDRTFKIWSAGCSSGEEPYTTAIVMSDLVGGGLPQARGWNVQIKATDISQKVLSEARSGIYPAENLVDPAGNTKGLTPAQRSKYFNPMPDGKSFQICDDVRRLVSFAHFNLMSEIRPELRSQHIIFCRNVMIYFDAKTRSELINRFYDALVPGGYLFIGHSETITRNDTKFEYVKPAIYRKGLG